MLYDSTSTIETFLNAAAAKQPTPGGGSVAALVGALSASMGEMVLNYSIGKKSLAAFENELRPALAEFTRARRLMQQLMLEDQAAFEAMQRIGKLPADSTERASSYPAALLACIRVPQTMAATAVAILELCDRMVSFANVHLLSDLAVCADLAMAATRCAVYNVKINLKDVTDEQDRRSIESSMSQLLGHAAALIQKVAPRIWQRVETGA